MKSLVGARKVHLVDEADFDTFYYSIDFLTFFEQNFQKHVTNWREIPLNCKEIVRKEKNYCIGGYIGRFGRCVPTTPPAIIGLSRLYRDEVRLYRSGGVRIGIVPRKVLYHISKRRHGTKLF